MIPCEILNARISSVQWSHDGILTHFIMLEGDGWGCGFGGYCLRDRAAFHWIMQVCDVLECDFNEKEMVGKIVRVKLGAGGGRAHAIGHPYKDIWFEPETYFERLRAEGKL